MGKAVIPLFFPDQRPGVACLTGGAALEYEFNGLGLTVGTTFEMHESPTASFLERIEKHYFFELERRDRIHASLRLLATMVLAILGAAWLLVSYPLGDDASALAQDLSALGSGLSVAAALMAMLGLVQASPIATEDRYEIALHENLLDTSEEILAVDTDGDEPAPAGDRIRNEALAAYLAANYADAALNNLALNEGFTECRRAATYSLMAAAVLIFLSAVVRYAAINA